LAVSRSPQGSLGISPSVLLSPTTPTFIGLASLPPPSKDIPLRTGFYLRGTESLPPAVATNHSRVPVFGYLAYLVFDPCCDPSRSVRDLHGSKAITVTPPSCLCIGRSRSLVITDKTSQVSRLIPFVQRRCFLARVLCTSLRGCPGWTFAIKIQSPCGVRSFRFVESRRKGSHVTELPFVVSPCQERSPILLGDSSGPLSEGTYVLTALLYLLMQWLWEGVQISRWH